LFALFVMIVLFVAVAWLIAAVVHWRLESRPGREESGAVSAGTAQRILDEGPARDTSSGVTFARRRDVAIALDVSCRRAHEPVT
jgi:hypothetical protein